jgi:hypothetical protein
MLSSFVDGMTDAVSGRGWLVPAPSRSPSMKSDHALAVRDSLARRPQVQIDDDVQEAPGANVGTDLATGRTRRPARSASAYLASLRSSSAYQAGGTRRRESEPPPAHRAV